MPNSTGWHQFRRFFPAQTLPACSSVAVQREHRVDRSYHLLHTFWKLLHVLIRSRVRSRVPQMRLNVLYRSQLLCPSGDGSPEHLEVQPRKFQRLPKWLQNSVPEVGWVQEPAVRIWKDRCVRGGVGAFQFPLLELGGESIRQM